MKKEHFKLKGILLYNIFFIISSIIFYYLIPIILNYPPDSINNEFERGIDDGMSFNVQFTMIIISVMIIFNMFFVYQVSKVSKYKKYINKDDEYSKKAIEKIRKRCFTSPYKIYAVHAIAPTLAIGFILYFTGAEMVLTLRVALLICAFTLVLALLSYISAKEIFTTVLKEIKNQTKYEKKINIGYKWKIFFLIYPLIMATIFLFAFATNSMLASESGDFIYENYNSQMNFINFDEAKTFDEYKQKLHEITKHSNSDELFIITENEVLYSDKEKTGIDDFFKRYTFYNTDNERTYGYYASKIQGVCRIYKIDGQKIAVGIMYNTETMEYVRIIIFTSVALLLMCAFFMQYFSKDICEQVVIVANNMQKIANEKTIDYDQKMPVLSNDEVGDLVVSFNKILDLEKKHALQVQKNQEIIVEQERLSSLGQMIGGIAHNLKTPIMSISGASQALNELINEYDMSISNPMVTSEDHHDIAKDMKDWNDKIKVYLEYMGEIIDAVKGQAVTMNASDVTEFTIGELVARVKILMKEQLLHRNCTLNVNIALDKNATIYGEISALVQVINNLIVNAIDAYDGKTGKINLDVSCDEEKYYITVEDYAGGIPESVQEKLFKKMITTKGKNGTGLGLYMCYSTIKGKFNGDMFFETKDGIGTKFTIVLNKNK